MTNNINSGSYAQYNDFDSLAYICVKYLMENDEVIWKLLKYNDHEAWKKPDLTEAEKQALIYNGVDNTADSRVFLDIGQPDVLTAEICLIRVSPYSIFPENRIVGTISMMFEVYSHYKINHLSNYKTRLDMVAKRFLQVFNGANIESGIGKLYFDRLGSESNRLENGGQLPFKGKWIIMSNKSP